MQLADAFDLPIVTLCDHAGNMVGHEARDRARAALLPTLT